MKKKTFKVQEPPAPYMVDSQTNGLRAVDEANGVGIRYVSEEVARKITKKVLAGHHELFRKLAQ